jgi:anti-anti-sigma factor
MAFNIFSETIKDGVKIIATGELDATVANQFKTEVENAATKNPMKLVLDFNGLDYLASAGLRALVFARQKMGTDVEIIIAGAHDVVLETIEMTGFHHSITLVDNFASE